jgi:hypothetical protein
MFRNQPLLGFNRAEGRRAPTLLVQPVRELKRDRIFFIPNGRN